MAKENNNAFILIEFVNGNQAQFDVRTDTDEQILTALLGLEGYLHLRTGLEAEDIRGLLDDLKGEVDVRPKDPLEDVIEVEAEDAIPVK